jgi:hypothetical protein
LKYIVAYDVCYTRNRERAKSQISMIRGMRNSGNSNKGQYERDDGLSRIRIIYTDELAYTDEEIRIKVFGKTSSTILSNSRLGMRNRSGTETYDK